MNPVQLNASMAPAVPAAGARWHAHLSALGGTLRSPHPAVPADAPGPKLHSPAEPRSSAGARRLTEWAPVALDPFWLNVPVRMRISCADTLLSAAVTCGDSEGGGVDGVDGVDGVGGVGGVDGVDGVDGYHYDDGSGRQRWIILPVPDPQTGLYTTGEYTISVEGGREGRGRGCPKLLAANRDGPGVVLADSDDGSGLQRWIFRPNDGEFNSFTMRVAGGKRDELVFFGGALRRDPVTQRPLMKLHSSSTGSRRRVTLELVRPCDDDDEEAETEPETEAEPEPETEAEAEAEAQVDPSARGAQLTGFEGTRIPEAVATKLSLLTKLTPGQIDLVQQLISLPENSTPQWYKNYGFVEFLGDGRGFTASIFGACSGTGDLAMVLEELKRVSPRSPRCDELLAFLPALKQKRGDDIRGIEGIKPVIQSLGDDTAWRQAVWATYSKLYWRFAMDYADKVGVAKVRPGPPLRLAASRGFMVDTAINHGANVESLDAIVRRMPASARNSQDERTWVLAFARARKQLLVSGYQELDTSGTGDRCSLWMDLVETNPDLAVPVKAYAGYWGSYTLS